MVDNQGENLRRVLKEKGIRQEDFGKMIDVTRGYVHQMFAKKRFKPKIVQKICTVLEIDESELLKETEKNEEVKSGVSPDILMKGLELIILEKLRIISERDKEIKELKEKINNYEKVSHARK